MNTESGLFPIDVNNPPLIAAEGQGDVWVVDDDVEQLEIISRYYAKAQKGSRLVTLNGPEEFKSLLNEVSMKNNSRPPSLIFMDINMPGQDGFQVLSDVKKTGQLDIAPIIMFSVSEREADIQKAQQSGASGYLTKPSRGSQYIALFKKILS